MSASSSRGMSCRPVVRRLLCRRRGDSAELLALWSVLMVYTSSLSLEQPQQPWQQANRILHARLTALQLLDFISLIFCTSLSVVRKRPGRIVLRITWNVQACRKRMHSSGINGEELRGQPANPGSPGKMAIKMVCLCVSIVGLNSAVCLLYL